MVNLVQRPVAIWLGLAAGPLGWMLHQQLSSSLEHFDCRHSGPLYGAAIGMLIGGAVLACGIMASRARARAAPGTQRFLATLGAASATIFLFAIMLQILAALIVPACVP